MGLKATIIEIRRNGMLREFENHRVVAAAAESALSGRGDLLRGPTDLYYFDHDDRRLYSLDSARFEHFLAHSSGLNPTEKDFAFTREHLKVACASRGRQVALHKLAHFDQAENILYISRFDGHVYKLDGSAVELSNNGRGDRIFLDDPAWSPFAYLDGTPVETYKGMFKKMLVDKVNFTRGSTPASPGKRSHSRLLIAWFLAPFFSSLLPTRPFAMLLGGKGSGKSAALRLYLKAVFGSNVDVVGLNKDKEDDFRTALANNKIIAIDNLDSVPAWFPDYLARACTGGHIKMRKLYTTAEEVSVQPDVWIGVTSRTAKLRRDDLVDRVVNLPVHRRDDNVEERKLHDEVLAARNLPWTDLIRILNKVVKLHAEKVPVPGKPTRMADWYGFVWLVARAIGFEDEFEALMGAQVQGQDGLLVENDPLIPCLQALIESPLRHRNRLVGAIVRSASDRWLRARVRGWTDRCSALQLPGAIDDRRDQALAERRDAADRGGPNP